MAGDSKKRQRSLYAGCDLGIISAKAAIIENGHILALEVLPYVNHPRDAAEDVMERALAKAGLTREQVGYCMATGFGKKAVRYADAVIQSALCLIRGVRELNPRVRTITDVGGHSFTAFNIGADGLITAEAITDICAAGTGRFLEVMADTLGVAIDDFGELALGAEREIPLNSQCTVFAESEVVSLIARDEAPATIARSLHLSVSNRIVGMAQRVGVGRGVVFIGGVARNRCIQKLLGERLGVPVTVPDNPQIIAALGAAIRLKEESDSD